MSDAEKLAKLIELTSATRDAQKRYFRTRSSEVLTESKAAERALDAFLAELATDQTKLF